MSGSALRLDAPPLRWAIAAPGQIASDFATTVLSNTRQRVVAVGSRSPDRAERFAQRFDIPIHGDYDTLERDDVDAVYIAAVNSAHAPLALRAIAAGKHVLVEKPFAMNADEAARVAEAARAAGVLVMEGMWTTYLPAYRELSRQIEAGALGEVTLAIASVGWEVPRGTVAPIADPETGGGVMLDMGVYPLWFAQFAVGRAQRVLATGRMRGDVDEELVAIIEAPGGRRASVAATMVATTSGHGEILGTEGRAVIRDHLVFASGFDVTAGDRTVEWRDEGGLTGRDGLAWEAAALADYVAEGLTESPLHSLDDTVALAQTMDAVRAQLTENAPTSSP